MVEASAPGTTRRRGSKPVSRTFPAPVIRESQRQESQRLIADGEARGLSGRIFQANPASQPFNGGRGDTPAKRPISRPSNIEVRVAKWVYLYPSNLAR